MKISYNWLKEYLDFNYTPQELSIILTDCGLEVEELAKWEKVRGGLDGVVTGEVVDVQKHPNADKLSVTKVNLGSGDPIQIVCGAPNVAAGEKVLVATVGTTLYRNDQPFDIKQARIRGEESFGMICAEDELGIGNSHEGIMVLPVNTPVGVSAKDYFRLSEDWVFTIGLTPNRIDAASHIGVAMDVAARMNVSENQKAFVRKPDISGFAIDNHDLPVEVIVEDAENCPRYSGLTLKKIQTGPSPKWLADRLTAAGMRPINNIVDITNYVMLELGHPLHAFDMNHVRGNKVVVKRFSETHEFTTLDEVKRTLQPDDLMICNSEDGMCIAGVFGGLESGVTVSTTEIFLESAYFNPVSVRKTSNRHALRTESSFRFERGTDPSVTVTALKRAAMLMKEIAGAEVSSPVYDVYPKTIKKPLISFSHEFVNKSAGHSVPAETQLSILRDLDFEIVHSDLNTVTVKAPYAKVDVTRPADIVEEILRIYGYNNIPFPLTHRSSLASGRKTDRYTIQYRFAEMLSARGFYEIMTNSLSSTGYYVPEFGFSPEQNVTLLNPLSNELNTMRRTLLFSGLESLVHNINRKQLDLKLYEFGKVYARISENNQLEVTEQFREEMHLALFMTGNAFPLNWKYPAEPVSVFHLKDVLHKILHKAAIYDSLIIAEENKQEIFSHALTYKLKDNGKTIACFGELSQEVLEFTGCRQAVLFAEINWDTLFEHLSAFRVVASEPPKYPEVHRDIAILLDHDTPYSKVREVVLQHGAGIVQTVSLFDVYEGKNIPEGKKSYAISIVLQDSSKTLTDSETDNIIEAIRKALITKLDAVIR